MDNIYEDFETLTEEDLEYYREFVMLERSLPKNKEVTLYHGSCDGSFNKILANSWNNGKRFEPSRKSSYWFLEKKYAEMFATAEILQKESIGKIFILIDNDMKTLVLKEDKQLAEKIIDSHDAYVYEKTINSSYVTGGQARNFPEYTLEMDITPDNVYTVPKANMKKSIKYVDAEYIEKIIQKYKSGNSLSYGASGFEQFFDKFIYDSDNDVLQSKKTMKKLGEATEVIDEGFFKDEKDIYYNKAAFDNGDVNLCFITGHSGSGKSTMARDMQKHDIENYEMDDLIFNFNFSDDNLKEYGDLIYSFFKGLGKKYRIDPSLTQDERNKIIKKYPKYEEEVTTTFAKYAMSYAKIHKDTKFVLEGIWMFMFMSPEDFKDYAVYIKGTSAVKSAIRATKRDAKEVAKTQGKDEALKLVAKRIPEEMKNISSFEKKMKRWVDYYKDKATNENHIPLDYLTEDAVEQLDEALNLGDMLLLFNEDAKNDALLKKLLYNGRMRTRKDLLEYYEMVKNDNPWIRYAYPEINRFQKRNLFIDTSYYNNLFFNNNTWTMKKGLGIFFDYMERVLKHASLKETGYEKLTIMIPVLGWGAKEDLWNYRQSLNPISMIYQYMYTGNLTQLRKVFGDTDIIFVASDKYFKINFKDITASDIKKYALKFKVFILKIVKNEVFDPEDIDTTADNTDSPEVVQAKIADKIEDSRGVDITPQLAKARSGSNTPVKDEKPEPGSVTKTRLNQKEDPEKESQERAKQKIADNIVYNTKDEVNNTEDDVLDSLDNSETKALILDLDPEDEDGVVVSPGRVTRMNQLNDKFLQSNVKGQTIRDILADESNKKEVKTDLKVSTPFDDWKQLEYVNFDKNYNLDKDILACFRHLQTVSRPISIRKIEVKDNSTSEDRVELYTVNMEDYRGKQFTVKLDIPIMVDNRFLLRGNHKSIQTQFFNMPIIKTEEDTVQIISNYMKIFVRRFRTGNGRALPETARLVKALHNYKGREVKVETGDNSKVCSKYNLPIDYIDLASEFTKIETPERVIYFNQDEMYKEHGDKIDSSKGVPYLYIKKNKGIAYYSPVDECTFTQAILAELGLDPACLKIRTLFDEAKAPSVCTFSRASILNSQIPLVVICAYHVGLRSTLDRAGIEYKISEKLSKDDKLLYGDYLKFKDGYVFYKPTYSSSMLLNGLKESNLSDYSLSEIDSRTMYLELLDNYGGRIKADGLDNFRDLMVDPMTKETLEFYHMPTDYIDILIYANNLLADNKFIKHTDVSSRRLRRYQLIAVYTYKVLADAYYNYSIQLKHTENVAEFMIKQSAVIDKFLTDTITSDDSVINALRDLETTNSITTKGPSGMNADRAYSLDKRTYDDSMLNVVGMSTGFASNVGITRQATMNANITPDGYVKTIDGKTDKMNTANTLTATEALTPFGSTHDDPMRTAMTFIQTAKHQVRTVESDPLLVTNGSDEALPYMSSDRFAFKAKKKGKVEELTDDYMIIKYLDGTKDFINLMKTIEKNSDGGYYVALKLDKSTNIKVGSNVEPGQIVAYDKESYSNSAGETDNLTYNIGKLGKIAILNTDEGFEDSGIISNRMAEALATPIDYKFDQIIDKDSIIYDIVKVGDHVEVGDALLTYQSPFDDEDANALMKMMGDGSDVSELGKRKITSEITGTVTAIKMFRTVETSEMSDSLKKIVNAYEKPLKEMKKKLEENNLDTSQVPAHYVLPAVGKLKKAEDAVLIEIYVEYLDTIGPGDKVVYFSANKAVEKNIFPVGKEPYTAYRPNEIIDGFVSETSIMKRMVCSTLTIGSINKLMIELDRHVKDIMGIPYDDSKV